MAAALIPLAALPLAASALDLDTSATGSGNLGVSVGEIVDIGAAAQGTGTSSEQSGSFAASGTVQAQGSLDLGVITITRDSASAATNTVATAANVKTSADLASYAKAEVAEDENVNEVSLSDEEVSVSYKQRAYLFGFIPVFVTVQAVVDGAGNVTVHYPWYGFLIMDNTQTLKADLQTAARGAIASETAAGLDATTQAQLLEGMRSALESRLEADVAAEASANASI